MCGRYELHTSPAVLALAFGLRYPPDVHPRYNICPMQNVPVVRRNATGERELVSMRWGLVPRWAKDPSIGAKMINARAETLASKPSFRNAFRRHRCLLPADGFYEWRVGEGGHKQPVLVAMADGRPFAFAGLFERWLSPEGDVLDTCTIVTTDANELLRPVHDRMPVIVAPEQYGAWLDPAEPHPEALLAPYGARSMTYWPVSTRVNNVRQDDASLRERVAVESPPHSAPPRSKPPTEASTVAPGTQSDTPESVPRPVQPKLF